MKVDATKLVYHDYSEQYVISKCSPVLLKSLDKIGCEEPTLPSRYVLDFQDALWVYSIIDIHNHENYGYFFFSIEYASAGNKKYTLTKVILDENLTENVIYKLVEDVITHLNGGNQLITNRLVARGDYPLVDYCLADSVAKVSDEIFAQFLQSKTGMAYISPEKEAIYKSIAEKMQGI